MMIKRSLDFVPGYRAKIVPLEFVGPWCNGVAGYPEAGDFGGSWVKEGTNAAYFINLLADSIVLGFIDRGTVKFDGQILGNYMDGQNELNRLAFSMLKDMPFTQFDDILIKQGRHRVNLQLPDVLDYSDKTVGHWDYRVISSNNGIVKQVLTVMGKTNISYQADFPTGVLGWLFEANMPWNYLMGEVPWLLSAELSSQVNLNNEAYGLIFESASTDVMFNGADAYGLIVSNKIGLNLMLDVGKLRQITVPDDVISGGEKYAVVLEKNV